MPADLDAVAAELNTLPMQTLEGRALLEVHSMEAGLALTA